MYYPYHNHTYMNPNHPDVMTREQEYHQQELDVLLNGIIGKASAVDFYSRLANAAPDEEHRSYLVQIAEDERGQWGQLTNLYTSLTGAQPMYQIEQIPFYSYQEGLQKGYEAELESYEYYRIGTMITQNPSINEVFMNACKGEWVHANRLSFLGNTGTERVDYGPQPFTFNIDEATVNNNTFRTAIWTGEHLQVTLMSINTGEDIGLEIHPDLDQFLRIEQGEGVVQMGNDPNNLNFQRNVKEDFAILIPAGTWHNLTNTGSEPLKLYSIYAPPQHPKGTVHETKADAMAAEEAEKETRYSSVFWG
jgi:mannose-6-phosphate isomerase-like protein (cupin superfamily)/rubrerythrin